MDDRVSKPALIAALVLIVLVLAAVVAALVFPLHILDLAAGAD